MVIIDFHTHIFPPDVISKRGTYLAQEEWFAHLYGSTNARMATAGNLVEEMDRCGISKAVVCGFAWNSFDLYVETNSYIADAVSRFPERLVGFANIPPLHPNATMELERCLDLGLKGIGELKPDGQEFDLVDEIGMQPLSALAAENGLPMLIHLSEPVGRTYPGKGRTSPRKGYEFALQHPDLKLVYAHWGGGLPFYELMPDVKKALTNVYYDCSASPFLYESRIYRTAIDSVGYRKILFGSDFPLISPERYMKELDEANVNMDEREAIMGGNASSFLGEVG